MKVLFKKNYLLFLFILGISAFLRFSYLTWGAPYFFHPDENNITNAIMQLSLFQWNPHFFAYGGLPIYTTFFVTTLIDFGPKTFATVAYTLRFLSATLSFLLIPSLFYIGKKMYNTFVGLTAASLASVSVGLIQFAHFGTFEMWLSFFTLWLFYACFLLWKNPTKKHIIFASLLCGILVSIKVSSIIFIPLPFVVLFFKRIPMKKLFFFWGLSSIIIFFVYSLTNPFLFFDTTSFVNALQYESSVAIGTLPVFYTQSFLHTIPVWFQLRYVLPFLVNPFVLVTFALCFLIQCFFLVRKRKAATFFLFLFFVITFFSQAVLFVKWTRYMVPTLPFLYLFLSATLQHISQKIKSFLIIFLFSISFIYACAFFLTVYPHDSRLVAQQVIGNNQDQNAIMEPYDIGALAFALPKAQIINLYDLDTNPFVSLHLQQILPATTLFISPSQRLLHTRLADVKDFPQGHAFYTQLVNKKLGFTLIYQTPCNFWCRLVYMGNPLTGSVEETASVFDHPMVSIFKKI